jgi:hypothetical protein
MGMHHGTEGKRREEKEETEYVTVEPSPVLVGNVLVGALLLDLLVACTLLAPREVCGDRPKGFGRS